jgi:hypothetical protein
MSQTRIEIAQQIAGISGLTAKKSGGSGDGKPFDWDALYCYLIDTTGQGWRELDADWDIPRLKAWNAYSKGFPGLREIVARYIGYKPADPTSTRRRCMSTLKSS